MSLDILIMLRVRLSLSLFVFVFYCLFRWAYSAMIAWIVLRLSCGTRYNLHCPLRVSNLTITGRVTIPGARVLEACASAQLPSFSAWLIARTRLFKLLVPATHATCSASIVRRSCYQAFRLFFFFSAKSGAAADCGRRDARGAVHCRFRGIK